MKTYGGPGGTTLHTLTSTIEEVITLTTRKFYYATKSPYSMIRKVDEPQNRSGRSGEEKSLDLARNLTMTRRLNSS
jgi:hypothetical protein